MILYIISIIARSAFSVPDGIEVKKQHYGFIKKKFLELKNGTISLSEITREDWQLVYVDKKCIYCGAESDLQKGYIVPQNLQIKAECSECDRIQSIHNQIFSCKKCNSLKGKKGLYEFYRILYPNEKKFYDLIPSLSEKKYLKTIYHCHECAQTLDKENISGDKEISVLDIDSILH